VHNGTNGHRFVFHQSEICATERRYVHGEPDVIRGHPNQQYGFARGERPFRSNEGVLLGPRRQIYSILTSPTLLSGDDRNNELGTPGSPGRDDEEDEYKVSSPSSPSGDIPNVRSDAHQDSFLSISTSTGSSDSLPQQTSNSPPMVPSTPPRPTRPYRSPDSLFSPTNIAAASTQCNLLCHGDVVWWHNLKRSGDVFGVSEEYAELFDSETEEDRMVLLKKRLRALR
jgi:hypothetical protein